MIGFTTRRAHDEDGIFHDRDREEDGEKEEFVIDR